MTPKEKAIELVDKYNKDIMLYWDLSYNQAKKCALIAVDELIANEHLECGDSPYWIRVKKEIETL
jgi:hypothetical protein